MRRRRLARSGDDWPAAGAAGPRGSTVGGSLCARIDALPALTQARASPFAPLLKADDLCNDSPAAVARLFLPQVQSCVVEFKSAYANYAQPLNGSARLACSCLGTC